jgi:hypothetical protein
MAQTIENISLKYIDDIFEDGLIEEIENDFKTTNINFRHTNISNVPMACYDEIFSVITIHISNDVATAYILGLITSFTYDIIRNSILHIWQSTVGKKYNKMSNRLIEEKDASIQLDFKINENILCFNLKGDYSEEDKKEFIDKAFDCIKDHKPHPDRELLYFPNPQDNSWEMIPFLDFINQQEKQKNKNDISI